MLLRSLQVLFYILHCVRLRVKPWLFFQLNAGYFNDRKGLFSKLDIDELIPAKWKLSQYRDTGIEKPNSFPVFVKPEWGQNSVGIKRAGSLVQLDQIRAGRSDDAMPYLIQEAAQGALEFEVYMVPSSSNPDEYRELSVTESRNLTGDKLPINSVHNGDTRYYDLTEQLNATQKQQLWKHIKTVGSFRMARFGIRADTLQDMVEGRFQIFEINLYLPMPLVVLCENVPPLGRVQNLFRITRSLAEVTGSLPATAPRKSIFFRKWQVHRQNRAAVHKTVAAPIGTEVVGTVGTKAALQKSA